MGGISFILNGPDLIIWGPQWNYGDLLHAEMYNHWDWDLHSILFGWTVTGS